VLCEFSGNKSAVIALNDSSRACVRGCAFTDNWSCDVDLTVMAREPAFENYAHGNAVGFSIMNGAADTFASGSLTATEVTVTVIGGRFTRNSIVLTSTHGAAVSASGGAQATIE
jgi:hypothetical protein